MTSAASKLAIRLRTGDLLRTRIQFLVFSLLCVLRVSARNILRLTPLSSVQELVVIGSRAGAAVGPEGVEGDLAAALPAMSHV
jgi:hypothetical protein